MERCDVQCTPLTGCTLYNVHMEGGSIDHLTLSIFDRFARGGGGEGVGGVEGAHLTFEGTGCL